jgi:hypothetical protein
VRLQDKKNENHCNKIEKGNIMINNKRYAVAKLHKSSALHLQKLSCANPSRAVGSCNISLFLIAQVCIHFPKVLALPT